MTNIDRSGSALVMPSNQYSTQDYEAAKFIITNGTASVRTGLITGDGTSIVGTATPLPVTIVSGAASGYAEGTTVGTITGQALVYRNSGGTLQTVQTGGSALPVTQDTLIAGEDLTNNVIKVEQRFSYTRVAAAVGTTVIKASAGFLHTVTLNGAATATNVTRLIDSASGTSSAIIAVPAATTATVPTTLTYDVNFANGLVIEAITAAGSDMTISWR